MVALVAGGREGDAQDAPIAIGGRLSYKSGEHPWWGRNVRHRTAFGLIILLTAISTGAQRAQAGLRFCNQGNFKFTVAVGYVDREKGWVAKGWAGLEGGQCKEAIKTPLDNRYYYFFAAGRGPDRALVKYSGETPFCVQSKKFVLYQAEYGKNSQEECSKDGSRSEMFMKIDVKGKPDYTINLGSPDNPPSPSAGPAEAPVRPPPVATERPPANQPPPPSSAAPSGGGNGAACQRYPNLC